MDKYYLCEHHFHPKERHLQNCLMTRFFLSGKQEIPIVLVESGGSVFEFFTKTTFTGPMRNSIYFEIFLPNSTLSYSTAICNRHFQEIAPIDALTKLKPFMKRADQCADRINRFFDYHRKEYKQQLEAKRRHDQSNSEAALVLSDFFKKDMP